MPFERRESVELRVSDAVNELLSIEVAVERTALGGEKLECISAIGLQRTGVADACELALHTAGGASAMHKVAVELVFIFKHGACQRQVRLRRRAFDAEKRRDL